MTNYRTRRRPAGQSEPAGPQARAGAAPSGRNYLFSTPPHPWLSYNIRLVWQANWLAKVAPPVGPAGATLATRSPPPHIHTLTTGRCQPPPLQTGSLPCDSSSRAAPVLKLTARQARPLPPPNWPPSSAVGFGRIWPKSATPMVAGRTTWHLARQHRHHTQPMRPQLSLDISWPSLDQPIANSFYPLLSACGAARFPSTVS